MGISDHSGEMSFKEEAERAPYFSGRVNDITNSRMQVVRSAVPIVSPGEIVGVLYGMIDLNDLKNRYKPFANNVALYCYDFYE